MQYKFFNFFKWILKILTKIRCSFKNKSPLQFPAITNLQFKHLLLYTLSQGLTQPTPPITDTPEYAFICIPSIDSLVRTYTRANRWNTNKGHIPVYKADIYQA